jgi:hypothetical protein
MSRQNRNTGTTRKRNTVTSLSNKDETNIQWGLERAIKTGLRIVEPTPYQLQLDIDSAGLLIFHEMQWSILEKAGITKGWKRKIKKSKRGGNHLHITITSPDAFGVTVCADSPQDTIVNIILRVAFQAILGSDLKREAFNLCRVLKGNKYPIVFFEKNGGKK